MTLDSLTALLTVAVALTAVIIGPLVQIRIARMTALRDQRQAWLETFRLEMSRFLSRWMGAADAEGALEEVQAARQHLFALFLLLDDRSPTQAALAAHLRQAESGDGRVPDERFLAEAVRLAHRVTAAEEESLRRGR